jgi:hypothetical protein
MQRMHPWKTPWPRDHAAIAHARGARRGAPGGPKSRSRVLLATLASGVFAYAAVAEASPGTDAAVDSGRGGAGAGIDAGRAAAVAAPGYPVDERPPKDFFSEALLRTLARESSAAVVCRLLGLVDALPQFKDPDIFYDATCAITRVVSGKGIDGEHPLHFIWQVERGNRMPPPQSELLVYLKARREPLTQPPPLKWIALDTGVLRYTPALKRRIERKVKGKAAGKGRSASPTRR